MAEKKLRILVAGAHPDDPDITCGGVAILWSARGHTVKFLSFTNGDTGHHAIGGVELARRRYAEAQASAKVAGIGEYQVLDNHCGELEATIANRKVFIRIVREFRPDLLITNRPNDYHPDHRAAALLVQDSSYIMGVPNMVSLTDIVEKTPVICYVHDRFRKPCPFQADVAVDTDGVLEKKFDMLDRHVSQMYEWLPYNKGVIAQVPADPKARRAWLPSQYLPRFQTVADSCRDRLVEFYGAARGAAIRSAEAFEVCEYGAPADAAELRRLFPFF